MKKTTAKFNGIAVPRGETIVINDGKPVTPAKPIIPFIEGDGIGPEISSAMRAVVDAAVRTAYGSKRKIVWYEVFAGEKAASRFGKSLPDDTLAAIARFNVAIKGPLNTPTGEGIRSLNVALRKHFDLFQCVRPVRYFKGVPSPMLRPQDLNIVIFRENTEDVYSGIEFQAESEAAKRVIALAGELGETIRPDSGIGIKVISRTGSKRLIRAAIQYAIDHNRDSVTIVHKGNIQKFTEGAFLRWGEELALEEFGDRIVFEKDLWTVHNGNLPEGKILLRSRIADAMFAELLLKPTRYSVVACCNLNGDYLSDAAAGQVGGLGIAPGANIGDHYALFEATHGTAPDIAGQNIANPCSLLLSAVMMLDFLGWTEAGELIIKAIEATIGANHLTKDLAIPAGLSTHLSTTQFGEELVKSVKSLRPKAPRKRRCACTE